MRVVIQKVTHASVDIEKQTVASINRGLLVLVGIEDNDTDEDIAWQTSAYGAIWSDDAGKSL